MSLPNDPQKFAEFLKLLNVCYQLSDEKLNGIQTTYDKYEYKYFSEMFGLLTDNFDHYNDDWKFFTEDLSHHISKRIHQRFSIKGEELSDNIGTVIEQLENETEYSLLGLGSGWDMIDVWVIKQSDKPKLLELAKELGFAKYEAY